MSETYAYDAFSNRLLNVAAGGGTRTLTYGDSGNTASDDDGAGAVLGFAYDSTDRLVGVSQGAAVLGAYTHNAMGQRVAKTAGGATTHFLYGLSGRLLAEHSGGGGVAREYFWLDGQLLGGANALGQGAFVATDHIGRPTRVIGWLTGLVRWNAVYRPFGELHSETGTEPVNLRFPGQYLDSETGLHYNYFRDYDASTGRYIQSDPIGLQGGWNTYAYVGGNPVQFIDPMGLAATCEVISEYKRQKWSERGTRYGAWKFSDDSGFRGKTADGVWLILSCIWKRTITDYRKDFERLVLITAEVCTDDCGEVSVTPIGVPQPIGPWQIVFEGEWARTQEFEDIVESARWRGPSGGVGGGAQAKSACGVLSSGPPRVY